MIGREDSRRPAFRRQPPSRPHAPQSFCLRHALFHLPRVLPIAGGAVVFGPLEEEFLGSGNIGSTAAPGFEHWPLQGTPIRKAQGPRVLTHGIHGIEVLGRLLGALATGEKHDTRHRSRYGTAETAYRGLGYFVHARLLWAGFA